MNLTLSIILSVAEIFGLLAIGGIARNLRYIDDDDIDKWSKLVLDFLYPAFVFTVITGGFKTGWRRELWVMPLIGLCISVGGAALGYLFRYGLGTRDGETRRTFLYFCAVNNYMFLPIIIVKNLWGLPMLANLFFLTLGCVVANWTLGVAVLGSTSPKSMIRNLMTPTLGATLLAFVIVWLGQAGRIPVMIDHILTSAGSISVPMMIVLSGASLFRRSSLHVGWPEIYTTMVRLAFLPAIAILVLKLLHLPQDIYALSVIVALMPLAVSSVIFVRIYGGNAGFAARASLLSTLAGIVTVPVALWFLFR